MYIITSILSMLTISILTPIQSILCLICLFISVSYHLYNDNQILMSILYILIYVGAITILFIFIISLLKINYNVLKIKKNMIFILLMIILIVSIPLDINNIEVITAVSDYDIYIVNEAEIIGYLIFMEYAIMLILISLLLLITIIGSIIITKH